jgi:phosphoribosyl-ATP pyrophosphohydrolase / phosphoribosyl-AMP cyclohydrolase / histidinol dehydrogenase
MLEAFLSANIHPKGTKANTSCGDYASGTNHTLPTYGYSRMYSGVNTHTFVKHITAQTLTSEGLDSIGDCVAMLAEVEGLQAHRNAILIRLKDIRKA